MSEQVEGRGDSCLIALSRPTLKAGVPFDALILNIGATFFFGLIAASPVWYRPPFLFWLAAIPIHMIMRRIVSWDFHGFRTIGLWIEFASFGRDRLGNMPSRSAVNRGEDIPSSV